MDKNHPQSQTDCSFYIRCKFNILRYCLGAIAPGCDIDTLDKNFSRQLQPLADRYCLINEIMAEDDFEKVLMNNATWINHHEDHEEPKNKSNGFNALRELRAAKSILKSAPITILPRICLQKQRDL